MKVQLLTDDMALEWLNTEGNRQAWRSLYRTCPWCFPTLGPDYYRLWFAHYGDHWSPLLILVFDRGKALRALFPLTYSKGTITGAGAHQAEYQGWLSNGADDAAMIRQVLEALGQRFPKAHLRLRYLAPGIPEALLTDLARTARKVVVEPTRRPLMCLHEHDITAQLGKKGTRSKMRRLQRQGKLDFRRLTNPEEIEGALDLMATFYDLRQGAVNDSCPFHDDPAKFAFTRDWLLTHGESEALFGCLMLDDAPIGGFIGTIGERDCQLAILAHDPRLSRHSPGKLVVYRTAQLLAREGVHCLDLTPGGDPWKERFANRHEPVFSLTVYARRRDAARVRVRRWLENKTRRLLAGVGISPAGLKKSFQRSGTPETISPEPPVDLSDIRCHERPKAIRRGQLTDLLRFFSEDWSLSRQAFLQEALRRLERGEEPYSLLQNDRLLAIGWLARSSNQAQITGLRCAQGREDLLEKVASAMLCDLRKL